MRNGRMFIAAAASLIAIMSAVDHAGGFGFQVADRERYSGATAQVTCVIDLNTLEIDIPDRSKPVTRLHLQGIGPVVLERSGAGIANEEATTFIRRAVAGRAITLAMDPLRRTRDREGRLLAYVYLGGRGDLLNQLLIEHGLADADRRSEHVLKRQLVEKADRASKDGMGLWRRVERNDSPR